MKLIVATLFVVAAANAFPAGNDGSEDDPASDLRQADIRAKLITKHNFFKYREDKSNRLPPKLPAPFVVSTALNVHNAPGVDPNERRGRTWLDNDGATVVEGIRVPDDESDKVTFRNGRFINNVFVPYVDADDARQKRQQWQQEQEQQMLQQQQQPQQLQRQPRQGFPGFEIPEEVVALADQVAVASDRQDYQQVYYQQPENSGEARDYKYHAGSTDAGRPVYYVVEDAINSPSSSESLHSDRSPYVYEPADTQTSLVADYTQQGYSGHHYQQQQQQQSSSSSGDFVIKQHTYSMCPGCPSFSIPVPVPKPATVPALGNVYQQYQDPDSVVTLPYSGLQEEQQQQQQLPIRYQHARNMTFLEKVGNSVISTMQGFQVSKNC